jgi:hypothetical protein
MQVMCFMDVPGPSDFPVGSPVAWLRAGQNVDGAAYAFFPFVVGRGGRGRVQQSRIRGERRGKPARIRRFGAQSTSRMTSIRVPAN